MGCGQLLLAQQITMSDAAAVSKTPHDACRVYPTRRRRSGSRDKDGNKFTTAQQKSMILTPLLNILPDDVALPIDIREIRLSSSRDIDRGKATIAK